MVAIWYIWWQFGIFFPDLVCCAKKNLATLLRKPVNLIKVSLQLAWPMSERMLAALNRRSCSSPFRLDHDLPFGHERRQGDRIGRIFAHWAFVFSGQFFFKFNT
jgi:hypothetical protein